MGESGADVRDAIIREIESRRTPDNGLYRLESDLLYEWEDMERTNN